MKRKIFLPLVLILALSAVAATYEQIYSEDFEGGTAGVPYACVYSSHFQPAAGDWRYSGESHGGAFSVAQTTYTDTFCGLPVTLDFSDEAYKVTFFSKITPDCQNWVGIGMQNSNDSLDVTGLTLYNSWVEALMSNPAGTNFYYMYGLAPEQRVLSDAGAEVLPSIGTDWIYHEIFINKSCISHHVYDDLGGNLLKSQDCLYTPLPETNGRNLAIEVSQQMFVTSLIDDIKVFRELPEDSDSDGILDSLDACPGTLPSAAVDKDGCSAMQFCNGFTPFSRSPDKRDCRKADWLGNEPKGNPKDCYIERFVRKDIADDVCTAASAAN
jgi:hypothetical protein